jgi:ABC-2 type transport system ATP-binding protein
MPESWAIFTHGLSKTYRVNERSEGLRSAAQGLFRRTYRDVHAVQGIDLAIAPGEVVGFIGPNGAGKTTTLKMLAGLLYPSAGEARVAGFVPWERKPAFLRRISMVLGNKSQMMWDIPALDSFHVLGEIYNIPRAEFKRTLDELIALLELEPLLRRPVRNLSLGERMKCELTGGLLHRPAVLFLDEPTLGLDVSMQQRLRAFFKAYNRSSGATIVLTSHYMADVVALCPRVVLIHQGRLLYDGELGGLAERMAPFKIIRFSLDGGSAPGDLPPGTHYLPPEGDHLNLRAPRAAAPAVTSYLLNNFAVADLTVEDPPIEAVIDQVYQEGIQ